MTKRLILTSILAAAIGASAAIKKAEPPDSPTKPTPEAPRPPAKPDAKSPLNDFLDKLKGLSEKGGDRQELKLEADQLEAMLRELLEKQGVAKEKLEGANFLDLLRMLQEQNPDEMGDFGRMFGPMDYDLQKKLDDQFRGLLDGHRPGTTEAAKATFILRDGKKPNEQLSLGTCVNADGWLLTKATEVEGTGDLQCRAHNNWVAAKVAKTWPEHDLALVKIDAKNLPLVKWSENAAPGVGTFITAAAPEGEQPVAIGVVSVAERSMIEKGRGFLGVQLDSDEEGLKVSVVVPNSAALKFGVQKDDRVLAVDGQEPGSLFNFTKLISDRKAGEKVNLKLKRGDEVIEKEIALGDRSTRPTGGPDGRSNKMNSMGSEISKRKDDFPRVIQSDFPLNASECGGPVTDLDGDVIGLVIARSGRVETMILPSAVLREVIGTVDFAAPMPTQGDEKAK